ncbi:hypothetical protein Q9L58_002240, partial [Maublancomyces gigas]
MLISAESQRAKIYELKTARLQGIQITDIIASFPEDARFAALPGVLEMYLTLNEKLIDLEATPHNTPYSPTMIFLTVVTFFYYVDGPSGGGEELR